MCLLSCLTTGYVQWVCRQHPEIVQSVLDEQAEDNPTVFNKPKESLTVKPSSIIVAVKESAELLFGPAGLTQRAYKAIYWTLQEKNILLARYVHNIQRPTVIA